MEGTHLHLDADGSSRCLGAGTTCRRTGPAGLDAPAVRTAAVIGTRVSVIAFLGAHSNVVPTSCRLTGSTLDPAPLLIALPLSWAGPARFYLARLVAPIA